MIILHQYHMSPFNQKIQRMLNHKGIPFEQKYWLLAERGKVTQFSPSGKLPALEYEGEIICDSTDIAWFIEKTFPARPLIPETPEARGMVHVLEDWADESLYFYEMCWRFATGDNSGRNIERMVENESRFMRWLMPRLIPGGLKKILANQGVGRKSQAQLESDTARHIAAVENLLSEGGWLVGDRLTLADLAVYAMFQCFRDADGAARLLDQSAAVTDWMARVEEATDHSAQPNEPAGN
jgi:glutathione S-transferase